MRPCLFFRLFSKVDRKQIFNTYKSFPVTGFEPWTSDVASDQSATAHQKCEKMSIQYTVPGLELTTFGEMRLLPLPQDQGSRPKNGLLFFGFAT